MLRILIIAFFCFLVACSSNINENHLILKYEDFGPQVIASEIIGMEWWQWQNHGESRPIQYDVKVVVFRDVSLNHIKEVYPIEPEKKLDYRYLDYDSAISYLDKKIDENFMEDMTLHLKETRKRIINKLGNKN